MLFRRLVRSLSPHVATPLEDMGPVSDSVLARLTGWADEFREAGLDHLGDIVVWRFTQFVQSVWATPERDLFVIGIAQLAEPLESATAERGWVEASTLVLRDGEMDGILTKRPSDEGDPLQQLDPRHDDPEAPVVVDLSPDSSISELIYWHRGHLTDATGELLPVDDRSWLETIRELERPILEEFTA